jgi:hypothetical protein
MKGTYDPGIVNAGRSIEYMTYPIVLTLVKADTRQSSWKTTAIHRV